MASGLVLFLIGMVLFVPLSCVYIFYLFRRAAQLSQLDPAYKWSKRLAYFVIGGLCCMVSAVPLMYLVMMVAQVFSIFAWLFALLGQGIVWIFFHHGARLPHSRSSSVLEDEALSYVKTHQL